MTDVTDSGMRALANLRADLASAQALRLALEANANLLDPDECHDAKVSAAEVYRLNAAHANRIYHRALKRTI